MNNVPANLVRIADLAPGMEAEFFGRLAGREQRTTRDGKPFYRVTFQDATGHVPAMIWHDGPLFEACDTEWQKGQTFRVLGRFIETRFGPQLELNAARRTRPEDAEDGFNEEQLYQSSSRPPSEMFAELMAIAKRQIEGKGTRRLVVELYDAHRDDLLVWPAASQNHHAYPGGFLEHVLSVTETAIFLAEKYCRDYPAVGLSKDLVVAGAMLHDVGKLIELKATPDGGEYTPAGRLIGHLILGRDLLRDCAASIPEMDSETLLRLEHILISHQGLPEWGSPIPPSTAEALLVHYADEADAKFHILAGALDNTHGGDEEFTSRDNPLRRQFYRGATTE